MQPLKCALVFIIETMIARRIRQSWRRIINAAKPSPKLATYNEFMKDTFENLLHWREKLLIMATNCIDYDHENQCPVCHCCNMELDDAGKGHKLDCLAEAILTD